jgi:hypothetical protein
MRQQLRLQQEALRRSRALLWHRVYIARSRVLFRITRHRAIVAAIPLLIAVSTFWIPALQCSLEPMFATEERLQGLR